MKYFLKLKSFFALDQTIENLKMFSNDDDSTVQSQWCEVSLGTDSEQEVRGRLRFRKDSLNSSETDSVESDRSENDVAGTASVLLSGTGSLWFLSLITS